MADRIDNGSWFFVLELFIVSTHSLHDVWGVNVLGELVLAPKSGNRINAVSNGKRLIRGK